MLDYQGFDNHCSHHSKFSKVDMQCVRDVPTFYFQRKLQLRVCEKFGMSLLAIFGFCNPMMIIPCIVNSL